MQFDDIMYATSRIAGISAIPVRIYIKGKWQSTFSLHGMPVDPIIPFEQHMLEKQEHVSYYLTPFHQYYGVARHEDFHILLGPIGIIDYSEQEQSDYAFALGIDKEGFKKLYERMKMVPAFPLENFLHMMLMINFYFNNEKLELNDIATYLKQDDRPPVELTDSVDEKMPKQHIEPPNVHNAMGYERQMLAFIREGDVDGLNTFFMNEIHGTVGLLSPGQLRNQKNLFIVTTTLVSRAAMEGGLPEEEAMAASDQYIMRCEELFSLEAINQLSYRMSMDYAARVNEIRDYAPKSLLISSMITYIRQNISAPLDGLTLAEQFNLSRNVLTTKFKAETGLTPAEFILVEKMRRAKMLLGYTEKPLAEISDYLGFASQSHFQTRFKTFTGQTPMEYRKENSMA